MSSPSCPGSKITSVGRLDPLQQAALRRLLLAVARRNPAGMHDALLDLA